MDKSILGGLLVIVIVAAVAGILVFNNMNPKTTGFSNPIKDNQTVNNNTNINESNVTQSSSTL
ncbi:MAG: hypothetical protein ACXVH2_06910, partial [Methanobacterium sp.]